MELPECDPLFLRYLDPWYTDADRARKGYAATRPDMLTDSGYADATDEDLEILTPEGVVEARTRIQAMIAACQTDWPSYLEVAGDLDLHWINSFDIHYDRARVANILENADPDDFSNDYLILACEFGAALGHVLQQMEPRLQWLYDWPYWESSLIDPRTGTIIPTFHWAIKKFSDYGVDDGFAAKLQMCVEILNEE